MAALAVDRLDESSPRNLEIARDVQVTSDQVASLTIHSRQDFLQAIEFVRHVKLKRLKIEKELGPAVSHAHQAHKNLVALRRRYDDVLAGAEREIKASACAWVDAEKHRVELEATRQEVSAEATATAIRQAQADELRSNGSAKEADALLGEPLGPLPPVVRRQTVPVLDGVSFPSKWAAVVTDLPALIAYCAANPQWAKVLQPNQKELGKLVRALRGNMEFPGVEVTEDTTMSVSVTKDGTGDIWDQ
jgi:hypothetical protein